MQLPVCHNFVIPQKKRAPSGARSKINYYLTLRKLHTTAFFWVSLSF